MAHKYFYGIFPIFLLFAIFFSFSGILFSRNIPSCPLRTASTETADSRVIVIDAGHGGEDGGACTYGEIAEKDLNLQISKNMYDFLTFCGIKTVMTRNEDILLYDKNSNYQGHKKSQDLSQRLKIARSYFDSILISIHMNAFPEAKYSGLQVYYSGNDPSSQILADLVQNNTKSKISPQNNRRIKKATEQIYLLNRFEGTGILIECGFMSNPEEYKQLCSVEYQKRLAITICESVIKYIDNISKE